MFVLIVTRKPLSAKMTVLSANTGLERNSQFSHLTEAVVNVAIPPTNEIQL